MKTRLVLLILVWVSTGILRAQTPHEKETFHGLTNRDAVSDTLPGPKYMQDHVVQGKLRLSLQDAILLALANNSSIRLQQLTIENLKYGILHAYQPFDPLDLTLGDGDTERGELLVLVRV